MRLSKQTLPSIFILVLQYIDNKFFFDASMDFETSFKVVQIADELKMRKLESELLCETIMQAINKQNVIPLLNTTHDRLIQKKDEYHTAAVAVPHSDDLESERQSERRNKKKGKRRKGRHRRN
mmetsp:Transcript_30020/g.37151  ORF Transcript_30020/g.37151 Transcript_30020/m.37151 type:complete len:123 (+) Transcript_30020:367-735(+)